jgi:hypothetical protein
MSKELELMKKLVDDLRRTKESIELSERISAELDKKREASFGDFALWLLSMANVGVSAYDTYQTAKKLAATARTKQRPKALPPRFFVFGPPASLPSPAPVQPEPSLSSSFAFGCQPPKRKSVSVRTSGRVIKIGRKPGGLF